MKTDTPTDPQTPADFDRVAGCAVPPGSASWIRISERLPAEGDVIACAAEHHEGGMMFWAGTIIEIWLGDFALIEQKGEKTRSYILTGDTLWMLLPSLPNTNVLPTPRNEAPKL